ncbi:glycosaminoglycan attachment site [Serratia fonticola]|uniref:glycosaminoglycan attachment site n=1 Tax=Serratia fonticola TaxID=47917 RepID=UPI00192B1554|nr:glycosaminoglycan attachment site [Serratia fonticola]MBL5859756.1 glycosaminoglycan attachment site [Serratia fonticola]
MSNSSRLDLFTDKVPLDKQHAIYKMITQGDYAAEREVLLNWSQGFVDRDGKFCKEFQTSFEPCLWELYLHAYLKEIGANVNFSYDAPDFVIDKNGVGVCVEATIAAPPEGGAPPYGFTEKDIPKEFNQFNRDSTIRICNSFTSKLKKLRGRYSSLPQCEDKPFVIAIASFDRPFSHMSGSRAIMAALYGLYHDEDATIKSGSKNVVSYNVGGVIKNENSSIDLGYFCSDEFSDVSAVIYSNLATWGKVRGLADNPNAETVYSTFHPNSDSLFPIVKQTLKSDYHEHLCDGLFVMHNPFAQRPIKPDFFGNERIAQCYVKPDGELDFTAPDDFLLMRFLQTITYSSDK